MTQHVVTDLTVIDIYRSTRDTLCRNTDTHRKYRQPLCDKVFQKTFLKSHSFLIGVAENFCPLHTDLHHPPPWSGERGPSQPLVVGPVVSYTESPLDHERRTLHPPPNRLYGGKGDRIFLLRSLIPFCTFIRVGH